MSISSRALLVTLNVSQWTARKLDKRESDEITRKHGAVEGAARVNKSLLPMAQSLDRIHKLTAATRNDYYRRTLPWAEGLGIIKSESYMDFVRLMSGHKDRWQAAVDAFVQEYPALREEARLQLNGLYRDEDYPLPGAIASRFRMDVAFFPVPEACDWRVELADSEVEQLREQITQRVMESEGRAMQEAWRRVYDVVSKAHDRLSNPDNIFRDSLIENARELCQVLPGLNIADDPALEKMRREIESDLCAYEPEDLRKNENLRAEVSDKLAEIMGRMGPMFGGAA